jgi:hypothetical protein
MMSESSVTRGGYATANAHSPADVAQARFLLAKLNPSSTHESQYGAGEIIFTDDVSLQVKSNTAKVLHIDEGHYEARHR